MNQQFMKEKKIVPLVLQMSVPMILSMAVNALYNIVDSYFVAKISQNAMTALSIVFPVQNMINAIAVGFGIGLNARIAYSIGANEEKKAKPYRINRCIFEYDTWNHTYYMLFHWNAGIYATFY